MVLPGAPLGTERIDIVLISCLFVMNASELPFLLTLVAVLMGSILKSQPRVIYTPTICPIINLSNL
uniref:Ig-like domain-containing protein n=1 Tax=Mesocestoides corti TaxID=53468 RepID=A0A5K3FJZ3_MESCO